MKRNMKHGHKAINRKEDAMRITMFVATLATVLGLAAPAMAGLCEMQCKTSSFTTEAYEECLKKCKPGGCDKDGACDKGETVANCPSDCERKPGPCDGEPGTKWCKLLDKCVAVADFATICKKDDPAPAVVAPDTTTCPSANEGKGGSIAKGEDCPSCFSIGMVTSRDGRSCANPCEMEASLFDVCPDPEHAAILAELKATRAELKASITAIKPCEGTDLTWLYILAGIIIILVLVDIFRKGPKAPTECPKCKKVAVLNDTCLACGHKIVPPPTPPAAPKPPIPRPTNTGSAPTTAP